jgi:hypothetical protein
MSDSIKTNNDFDFQSDKISDYLNRLVQAYSDVGRTLDSLPYTDDFKNLCGRLPETDRDEREVLQSLFRLRKAGKLPRLGRTFDSAPSMSSEEEEYLASLVVEAVGSLGARDGLPYSSKFDLIHERFMTATKRSLSAHELWRLIVRLAK